MFFPLLRKDIFRNTPSFVKNNLISIIAMIALVIFLYMASTILVLPEVCGPITELTITWVAGPLASA